MSFERELATIPQTRPKKMTTPLSFIDSLPNKLLSRIQEEAIIPSGKPKDFLTLSSISLVCKNWRETCFANGLLREVASDPNDQPSDGIEEAFHSANGSLLTITSGRYITDCTESAPFEDFMSDTWQRVFDNTHRWEVFMVQTHLHTDSALAYNLERLGCAPELTSFALANSHIGIDNRVSGTTDIFWDVNWRDDVFILPDNLFGRHAPRLKSFFISHVYLTPSFNFSLWTNLTSLTIIHSGSYYDHERTMPDWLGILRSMSLLEHLELKGTFSFYPDSTHVPPDFSRALPVHLKRLSVLRLGTSYHDSVRDDDVMFDVFSKLIVPSSCKISIWALQQTMFEYPPHIIEAISLGWERHIKELSESYPEKLIRTEYTEPRDLDHPTEPIQFTSNMWQVDPNESNYQKMVPNFEFVIQLPNVAV
ncbi:hypothetical protein BDN70DRAFT_728667 [Pholiota conissans]|uniref:F-box domain-containing protein n=1 Tax=Pholiota conissans TaxID=109636 RepID=A0A9P5Z272_9AGAR|nr:hypothetical protein BDN70DRAFT_728667 [Pholiota conissans]